ncbi:MAG: FadD3 family acyl-CoA ligase [Lapillicoccus sp.]
MTEHLERRTIPDILAHAARTWPSAEAVVDGDLRVSYARLAADVHEVAAGLMALGTAAGDRVAVWAPNGYRWVVAALGTLQAGGVLVPVNTRFRGEEAAYVLRRSGASVLVVDDGFLGAAYLRQLLKAAAPTGDAPPDRNERPDRPVPGLPDLRAVVTLAPHEDEAVLSFDELLARGRDLPVAEVVRRAADVAPADLADILFTSGTTGDPKGAMTSHGANVVVNTAWAEMVGLRAGDRYLLVNPLFHSFGYRAGLLAALLAGATLVPMAVFDPAEALRLVEAEQVTVFPGAPAVYTTLLEHPDRDRHDTGSVRLVVTGAAVVPLALIRRIKAELGFGTVITAYGLTESCGTATVCPPDAPEEKVATTSGRAIPGTELRISDPGRPGSAAPVGSPGEVLVRGVNVMQGYWQDPEATAAAVDAEGWLHTGDVGVLDADGYLTITDRIKDMFTVGGFNVYPAEVERLLVRHPGVADAAVVAKPDERLGEVGLAYVVLRSGATVAPEDVVAFCREHLANFKVPREVQVVDALPRTASGKVQKFRLAAPSPHPRRDPRRPPLTGE